MVKPIVIQQLVYSDKELDLIMDAVPDSTRILLGIGELDEVQQVLSLMQSTQHLTH